MATSLQRPLSYVPQVAAVAEGWLRSGEEARGFSLQISFLCSVKAVTMKLEGDRALSVCHFPERS